MTSLVFLLRQSLRMDGYLYRKIELPTILPFQYIMAALFGILRHLGISTRANHFSPQKALENCFVPKHSHIIGSIG